MIRKADAGDLHSIKELFADLICWMKDTGLNQWDESYPGSKELQNDLVSESMFLFLDESKVVGVVTLDSNQSPEYAEVSWSGEAPVSVIHRLAVHPKYQGRGIARKLMDHCEMVARESGTRSIRLDAYIVNERACGFYSSRDYVKTGRVRLGDKTREYQCFEKILGSA